MNPKIKNVLALLVLAAASITLVFAVPHSRHPSRTPKRPAGNSITLDNNFNAPFFATQVPSGRGVLLPDGKYVLFFNIDTAADRATGPVIRYNADGSFDNSFSFSRDYAGIGAVVGNPDGKLIVGGAGKVIYGVSDPPAHSTSDILRLNLDGSIDPTFEPTQTTDGAEVRGIALDPNGNILIAGLFTAVNQITTHGIVRLLPNGGIDPDFNPVSMTCPIHPFGADHGCGLWADPVVDADGKIIIGGDFIAVNGAARTCVARLNPDGTLDQTFNPSGFTPFGLSSGTPRPIRGIAIQSDGKIVIGGRFEGGNCNNQVPLVRLNADGSRDGSYIYADCLPPNGMFQVRSLVKDTNDKMIAVGLSMWRFNIDGSLDNTFHNPVFAFAQQCCYEAFNVALGNGGTQLFVGGGFTDVDDVGGPSNGERFGAAKFNAADGSLDTGFTTSGRVGWKIEPNSFLRQSNALTLISFAGPGLEHYPPVSHSFGRLSSTGELDLTFDPIAWFNPNGPLGPNFLATGFTPIFDGTVLITGVNGVTANYGRLLPDGSEDPSFHGDAGVTFANAVPRADGKMIVSQYDPNLNDPNLLLNPNAQAVVDGTEVRRINATGSLDNTFQLDPNNIVPDTLVRDGNGHLVDVYVGSSVLALTANDTVLFGYLSRNGTYRLVRLNSSGSIDTSFDGQTFPVQLAFNITQVNDPVFGTTFVNMYYPLDVPVKQAKNVLDNKVVLMGSFASYGGVTAHGMLRIRPDGSADPDSSFSVGEGAQWTVTPETEHRHPSVDSLEVGLNNKLLVTGTFEAFNNAPAPGIISLNPDGSIDHTFAAPVQRQKFDYQPAFLKRQPDGSFLLSGPYSRLSDNFSPSFFRLLLPPGVPTPPGTDVTVDLGGSGGADDITVNFNDVQSGGTTSAELIDPEWAGELPSGYQIAGADLAFEIWTTATYGPPIQICFVLSELNPATFAAARIFHNDGTGLVDVTSSKDFATQTICATVNSLSPFIVLRPTRPTPGPRPRPTPHPRPTPRQ
ncbi:MAG TPA: delta-60 repeat domain-containing protein [Lacipirellulaceae bacterium]|nr:delta-60 repeat domain-containing protein [Lacipirellulaceae bacterium]